MFLHHFKSLIIFTIMILFTACGTTSKEEVIHETIQETVQKDFNIKINEILASNKSTIKDPDNQKYADYIELYNDSDTTVDISHFGLSDKTTGTIWRFPTPTTITGKGYLLVWADKKNMGLHTNFKLNSDGEDVILYDNKTDIIDRITYQTQGDDIAITRDKNNKLIFVTPSPLKANNITAHKIIDDTIQTPISEIYINELMARNIHTIMDTDFYAFSDWIELYNSSNHDINLTNYKISTSTFQNGWSIITKANIPAKGYTLLFLDKKDLPNHCSFTLEDTGSSLTLFSPTGEILDKVNFKKQKSDISYGRDRTTKHWGYMQPSFKQMNKHTYGFTKRTDKPHFSSTDNNKTIMITTTDNGTIYYTTDGSTPTKDATLYQNPLAINQTVVLKAMSLKEGYIPSKVQTQTYFKNLKSTLPVISLSINPDYLFDAQVGIYVEGNNSKSVIERYCGGKKTGAFNFGNPWDRPAHMEYYDQEKKKVFSLSANLAISGACSRINAKKSFSYELDKKYGTKSIKYPLYEDKENITITDLRLRTGSSGYMITDMLAASLVSSGNLDIDYQSYTITKMYINGEYWGIYHIREKKGKGFIQSNYPNISKQNIDIISAGKAKAGNLVDYQNLLVFINDNNLSIETNYQNVLNKIDLDNYIDYMCIMIFSGAQDWLNNNTRLWKEKLVNAKWRWILDDVDGGFVFWRQESNNFQLIKDRPNHLTAALFIALSQNQNFKNRFKLRFSELLDTTFSPENILHHINMLSNKRQVYMAEEKWGAALSRKDPKTIETFVKQTNSDLEGTKEFAEHRRAIVKAQLNLY